MRSLQTVLSGKSYQTLQPLHKIINRSRLCRVDQEFHEIEEGSTLAMVANIKSRRPELTLEQTAFKQRTPTDDARAGERVQCVGDR